MRFNRKGFTLIELIIVVIIIGILAAIAAPMMSVNVNKAKRSEAIAALGAIKTAARLYNAENGAWPTGTVSIGSSVATMNAYITNTSLDGRYFLNSTYGIDGSGNANCNVAASTDSVNASTPASIVLYQNGTLVS